MASGQHAASATNALVNKNTSSKTTTFGVEQGAVSAYVWFAERTVLANNVLWNSAGAPDGHALGNGFHMMGGKRRTESSTLTIQVIGTRRSDLSNRVVVVTSVRKTRRTPVHPQLTSCVVKHAIDVVATFVERTSRYVMMVRTAVWLAEIVAIDALTATRKTTRTVRKLRLSMPEIDDAWLLFVLRYRHNVGNLWRRGYKRGGRRNDVVLSSWRGDGSKETKSS